MNRFWGVGNGNLFIFTTQTNIKNKIKKHEPITYHREGRLVAIQYLVQEDSELHNWLVKQLNITDKDRLKTKVKKVKQ